MISIDFEGLFVSCIQKDGIQNYIFQQGQSSMATINRGWLCFVKLYIYTSNFTRNDMTQNQPVKIVIFRWVKLHLAWWELETTVLFGNEGNFRGNDYERTIMNKYPVR